MFPVTVLLGTTAGVSGRRDSPCLREEGTSEKLHLVTELQDQRGLQLLGKNSQAFSQQVFTEYFWVFCPLLSTGDTKSKSEPLPSWALVRQAERHGANNHPAGSGATN